MESQNILYTKDGAIATITINRPRVLNAYDDETVDEWVAAIEAARRDPEVKVLVVTGAGRAFCAGMNPRTMGGGGRGLHEPKSYRVAHALKDFSKPYVGAINGPAAGGGLVVASMG